MFVLNGRAGPVEGHQDERRLTLIRAAFLVFGPVCFRCGALCVFRGSWGEGSNGYESRILSADGQLSG